MASNRRSTHSLPLRQTPAHVRAARAQAAASARARAAEPASRVSPEVRRVLVTLAVVGGFVLLGFLGRWAAYGDLFRVRDVRLVGIEAVDPLAVGIAANVQGKTLVTIDRGEVAAAVGAVPGVQAVEVRRDWPHALVIDVTERQGWGYWQVGEHQLVVDREGRVLEAGRQPGPLAPVIFEEGAPEGAMPDPDTVALVARLLEGGSFDVLRVQPSSFVFHRERGLTVVVDDSPDAVFGDSHNFEFKVATWGSLLDKVERQHLDVGEIDLRFGKHVVMR